jgi:hypothetical protein
MGTNQTQRTDRRVTERLSPGPRPWPCTAVVRVWDSHASYFPITALRRYSKPGPWHTADLLEQAMGFMSNQWLNRGQGLRNRSYGPVPVTASATKPTSSWSKRNEVAVEIIATRPNGQFQTLHLTAGEAEKAASIIVKACSKSLRMKIADELLDELSDADLHAVLAGIFRRRVDKAK